METKPDFRYISLGAGVQSTAVLVLGEQGKLGKVDAAIFADTGDEPAWVYEHLERLKAWAKIPIEVISEGVLSRALLERRALRTAHKRFPSLPAFTLGSDGRAAPLRRQCTAHYKIDPIQREVRRQMGFKKGERIKGKATAEACIGISTDEATRMKPSRTSWIENRYPLIELGMSREACLRVTRDAGLPEPKKSSCVFCPYHSDAFWVDLRDNHPEEWQHAVEVDAAIRDQTAMGLERPIFLHRSLKALPEVTFRPKPQQRALDLFDEECEGVCGV